MISADVIIFLFLKVSRAKVRIKGWGIAARILKSPRWRKLRSIPLPTTSNCRILNSANHSFELAKVGVLALDSEAEGLSGGGDDEVVVGLLCPLNLGWARAGEGCEGVGLGVVLF